MLKVKPTTTLERINLSRQQKKINPLTPIEFLGTKKHRQWIFGYKTRKGEKILEGLGLTKLGLIDKKREKFKLGEFEVCLDKVKGIGSFVEVETQGNTKNWKQKRMECIELLKKIGLNEKSLTNEFLCDIATRKV
ncbi:MAG: CYTH domain-containing protein [Candidatus Diapherotrites archaeon]